MCNKAVLCIKKVLKIPNRILNIVLFYALVLMLLNKFIPKSTPIEGAVCLCTDSLNIDAGLA